MTDVMPITLCLICALVVTCQQAQVSRHHFKHHKAALVKHATPAPTPAVIDYDGKIYKLK